MPERDSIEIPYTEARLKWAVNIRAGIDLESTLGLTNQATNMLQLAAAGLATPTVGVLGTLGGLQEVGTAEDIDLGNNRDVTQRIGFNSDPTQPFQVAPHGAIFTLQLSRIVLKVLPPVEASFNFFPSNLLFQQLPFVIELQDIADANPANFVTHYIYGCWFAGRKVRYSVSTKDDTRLIETATVIPGRVVTVDPSFAGGVAVQSAQQALGGLFNLSQSNQAAANVLENFQLS
jgi:hypothetical protein